MLTESSERMKEKMISSLRRDSPKCTELVHQGKGIATSATVRKLQLQEAVAGWRSTPPVVRGQKRPPALLATELHRACWNLLKQTDA